MAISEARKFVIDVVQEKEFPQQRLLDPAQFEKLAKSFGLHVGYGSLETWDRVGVLHPIYRTRPDMEILEQEIQPSAAVREERLVWPSAENFIPWADLRRPYARGYFDPNPSNIYFHPFQISRLHDIVQSCHQGITFADFACEPSSMDLFQRTFHEELQRSLTRLRETEEQYLQELALLLLIEDKYLPDLTGWLRGIRSPDRRRYKEWREAFDADAALRRSGLSVEQVEAMRRDFGIEGELHDPNEKFYVLLRHMTYDQRQELKNEALLPWFYYGIADMLGRFLEDVTGQKQPHVDDLSWPNEWKKRVYGFAPQQFDYAARNALPNILRVFGIDPRIKVLFIVEGQSEIAFVKRWCERNGIHLEPSRETGSQASIYLREYGIDILMLQGVSALKNPLIRHYARRSLDEGACIVMAVDAENDAADQLMEWKEKEGLIDDVFGIERLADAERRPLGGLLWDPCFEETNFTFDELLDAWMVTARSKSGDPVSEQWLHDTADLASRSYCAENKSGMTAIKLIERIVEGEIHTGRLSRRERVNLFDKPRIAEALAERYWDTDRPIIRLLDQLLDIAERAKIARYLPPHVAE